VLLTVLGGGIVGCGIRAAAQSPWKLKISLNAPSLSSPAVPFAIFDFDPLPKFSAALGEMRESFKKQLHQAPDAEQLEIIRSVQMLIAWNSLFAEIQNKIVALSPSEVPKLHVASGEPPGPKWIVSMTVLLKGESHPVCWSQRAVVEYGKTVPVIFGEGNLLHLEPIYDSIMAARGEKI